MRDIASLVELGARHITFGDPDFLNGRRHSLRVVQAMHERFPDLTFDCTTKVEHMLRTPSCGRRSPRRAACSWSPRSSRSTTRSSTGSTRATRPRKRPARSTLLREHGIEIRPS